jgi:2-polyprenyl-6-methoxyphenol hydroxylase-like FAD-dependent oxidoreductase
MNQKFNKADKAIVIGGSMVGLITARILSDYFAEVTVLDRDALPETPEARNGAPQARHGHILLARGLQILETLFPGYQAELFANGATPFDWGTQYVGLLAAGWVKTAGPGRFVTICASRLLLEHMLRERTAAIPNIKIIQRADVHSLIASPDNSTVLGVNLESRTDHQKSALFADLVVDCSGRNSKAPEWLQALGYDAPTETHINAHVGYATRWYRTPAGMDWKFVGVQSRPNEGITRGGGFIGVENGLWTLTLQGVNKDYPPTDEAGFEAYVKTFASPIVYDLMKRSEPVGSIYGFRYAGSRIRHFEKLKRYPKRLLVLGDAVCSFNPIYGQGMTTGAMQAEALGQLLGQLVARGGSLDMLGDQLRRRVAQVIKTPWMMATAEDLRFPGTEGAKPGLITQLSQRYTDLVISAMPYDGEVSLIFSKVANLIAPTSALMTPGMVFRVLRQRFFGNKSQAAHGPNWKAATNPASLEAVGAGD